MARLNVEAVADESSVVVGSVRSMILIVSITDDAGQSVQGLSIESFKVSGTEGISDVVLKNVFDMGALGTAPPGFYNVQIAPSGNNTWAVDVYIVPLAVTRTHLSPGKPFPIPSYDHGQTVVRIAIAA
jgi:hypothetical protein